MAHIEENVNALQGLGGDTRRKQPLGRPRRRWEDNVKTDLTENNRKLRTGYVWFRVRISSYGDEP